MTERDLIMPEAAPPDVRRVNVNFSTDAYETLKTLAALRGSSLSEVLRQAITLFKWFEDTRKNGGRILVERNGQLHEVVRI